MLMTLTEWKGKVNWLWQCMCVCVCVCTTDCERQTVMTSLFPHEIVFPKLWFSTLPPSSNTTQSSLCFSVCSEPRLSDGVLQSCCSHQKKKVKLQVSFFTVTAGYGNIALTNKVCDWEYNDIITDGGDGQSWLYSRSSCLFHSKGFN